MALRLDICNELAEQLSDLRLDEIRKFGRKHILERQRFLADLLCISYEGRRPHAAQPGADSFDRDFLVRGLRVSPKREAYSALMRPFYTFPEGNYGYSKDAGLTKPYWIRPNVLDAVSAVYASNQASPVAPNGAAGNRTSLEPEANGLPPGVAGNMFVPALLPFSTDRIDSAIERVTGWAERCGDDMPLDPSKPTGTTLADTLRHLYACRKWTVSVGGVPNVYAMQSHGRLGPDGFHLIVLPNRVRHLLFEGCGLADYDIESCFWSIFCSLGRALGFSTRWAGTYIRNKRDCHARWKGITGHSNKKDFKAVAASWLCGGTLSPSRQTESARRVGSAAMRVLRGDRFTEALYREVRAGLRHVVAEASGRETDGKETVFVNAVGARLTTTDERREFGRICAHLLTGYEQFAIREASQLVSGLQAIIYDGFIAPPQPTPPLEKHLRERSEAVLGFSLDLRFGIQDLSEPLPDREPDPWDF